MKKYVRKVPLVVEAKQITENGFDGFGTFCAHSLDCLIVLDERFVEDKYRNSMHSCEYEDDGYCLKKGDCECKRKIGYVRVYERCHYRMPSDYIIKNENGQISFMKKEEFEMLFEELKEE